MGRRSRGWKGGFQLGITRIVYPHCPALDILTLPRGGTFSPNIGSDIAFASLARPTLQRKSSDKRVHTTAKEIWCDPTLKGFTTMWRDQFSLRISTQQTCFNFVTRGLLPTLSVTLLSLSFSGRPHLAFLNIKVLLRRSFNVEDMCWPPLSSVLTTLKKKWSAVWSRVQLSPSPGRALIVQRDGAARPKDHTGPNFTQCNCV